MKHINPHIINQTKKFKSLLKKYNISTEIILFGSHAKNQANKDSDIDLAVISNQFGKDEIKELMTLKKMSLLISDKIDPIPLSKKYMRMKYHPLIGEIKKYGYKI